MYIIQFIILLPLILSSIIQTYQVQRGNNKIKAIQETSHLGR